MLTDLDSEWPRSHGKSVLNSDACPVQRATVQICGPLGMIGFHMMGMDFSDSSLLFSWLLWAFGCKSPLTVLESCLWFQCCHPSPRSPKGGPRTSSIYITWVPVRNIESCPLQDYWFRMFTFNKIPSLFICVWMFEKRCSNPEHSTVCVCSEWLTGVQWGTGSYSLQVAT